jgi:hypothetical protein
MTVSLAKMTVVPPVADRLRWSRTRRLTRRPLAFSSKNRVVGSVPPVLVEGAMRPGIATTL